jgi:glutathione S-transferase
VAVNLSGDQYQPDFLAMNPFHHIPVLVDGEQTLIESFAILDYLEAKYPDPPLLPKTAADLATVRMVQMVTVNELLPTLRPMMARFLFGKDDPDAIANAQQQVAVVLGFLASQLGDTPFFAGHSLTLADIVAGNIAEWFPQLGVDLSAYPTLQSWRQRLMARPAWQQTQATPDTIAAFKARMQQRQG